MIGFEYVALVVKFVPTFVKLSDPPLFIFRATATAAVTRRLKNFVASRLTYRKRLHLEIPPYRYIYLLFTLRSCFGPTKM